MSALFPMALRRNARTAHRALDEAVFAAYGWNPTITSEALLAQLLALNLAGA
jgi:hypothetical protein